MSWLILGLSSLALAIVSRVALRRQRQIQFIRQTLASPHQIDNKRLIASITTLPDRIHNLEPTIRSLLNQTRPPDEIVLAIPEFSIRQKQPYSIPKYLSEFRTLRILRCQTDWGPATKFIPLVQEELAAGRPHPIIIVVG